MEKHNSMTLTFERTINQFNIFVPILLEQQTPISKYLQEKEKMNEIIFLLSPVIKLNQLNFEINQTHNLSINFVS